MGESYVDWLKNLDTEDLIQHAYHWASQAGSEVDWLEAQLLVAELADRLKTIPQPRPSVKVEDMQCATDHWSEGDPLPPGVYEVAVLYHGQDNVIVEVNQPTLADDVRETAIVLWKSGETTDMGNEWETYDSVVISPITLIEE